MAGLLNTVQSAQKTWTPYKAPMSDMTTPGDLAREGTDSDRAHEPAIIAAMSAYRPGSRQSANVEDRRGESRSGNRSFPPPPQPIGSALPQDPYPMSVWMPSPGELLPMKRQHRLSTITTDKK